MKNLGRLVSFLISLMMVIGMFQMPASALNLKQVDYTLEGTYITRDTESGEPDAQAYLDSTVKYSGNYSLKIQSRPSANSNKEFRVGITASKLKKGDYKLSFMMKADRAKGFQLTMTGQSKWWQLTNVLGSNFDWMPIELDVDWETDAVSGSVVFISYAENNGIWIDDLKMLRKDDDGVYREVEGSFSNGDFESTAGTITIIKPSDEGSDSETEAYKDLSASEAVVVAKAEDITIDGDTSDWSNYEAHAITDWYEIVASDESLTASIKYAYDEEAFYYLVEAIDDVHRYVAGSTYWSGDGLQTVFDNNNDNGYGEPIGVYYADDKNITGIVTDNGGAELENGGEGNVCAKATRIDDKTTYEVKVPWSYLGMECPNKIRFNLIVNDNDTGTRVGFRRIAPGVGETKHNDQYPYMVMGEQGGSVVTAAAEESEVQVGEAIPLNFEYSNIRNVEEDVEIRFDDQVYNVTVKPMMKYTKIYELAAAEDIGAYYKDITVKDGEGTQTLKVAVTAVPNDEFVEEFTESIASWVEELEEIQDQCTAKGYATDYENADIRLLETYIETIPEEASYGNYSRIALLYNDLPKIYEECRESLKAILSGEKVTEDVPKYVTSNLELRDGAWWGTVVKDGVQYESPLVFNGINSFRAPFDWEEDLEEYGLNEAEIGIYTYLYVKFNGTDFEIIPEEDRLGKRDDEYSWERVIEQLENCEKKGISVSLIMNYIGSDATLASAVPGWITPDAQNHGYNAWNVSHPKSAEMYDATFKVIGELCDKYECIDKICLSNEPTVKLYGNSYYDDEWAQFLSDRYDGDIEKLNKVYGGTKYTDFTEIEMPSDVTYGLPLYHDYRLMCEDVYRQWLKYMSDAARKYTDVPICIKEMQRTRKRNSSYTISMATTAEKNTDLVDLAGFDAFYVMSDGDLTLDVKMMWYDYENSVMEAPIQNGEDHIGSNGLGGIDDIGWNDFSFPASNWQGIIHGGGAQDTWMYMKLKRAWDQTNNVSEFEPPSNLIHQPNALRGVCINNLDALRLAFEVNALYSAPRNVGIFWSNTDWSYDAKFMNSLYRAYVGTYENGQKAKFITESTFDHLDKVDVLIVPGVTHTLPETLDEIKDFIDRGGKVIMLGEGCFKCDDFGQPFEGENAEKAEYIRRNSSIIESDLDAKGGSIELPENFNDLLYNEFEKLGYTDVVVIDKATGERATGVEFIHTEYDGKMLVNPFNYSREEEKIIEIYVNGEKAEKIVDLKNNETYYGEMTLGTQSQYLVEIDMNDDDTFKDIAHVDWAKDAIYGLKDKNVINGVGDRRFAPDLSVKREELAKMIVSVAGSEVGEGDTAFGDVDSSQWYASYVAAAYKDGIVQGLEEDIFGTGEAITRQDLAVMVYRAALSSGKITADGTYTVDFADAADIAEYAAEAVAALAGNGAINGSDNNMFKPGDVCTRAEAAKIIYNIFYK